MSNERDMRDVARGAVGGVNATSFFCPQCQQQCPMRQEVEGYLEPDEQGVQRQGWITTTTCRVCGHVHRHKSAPRVTHTTTGTVKWWRSEKGTGAISTNDTAPDDIWCQFAAIDMPGFKTLESGQRVEVEYERLDRESFKYVAVHVRVL